MEQEKIERIARIILKNFEPTRPNISSITLCASVAAAEIAKEFEQLQRQLDARRELNDELRAENTQLLAQLADMQQRLIWAEEQIEGG